MDTESCWCDHIMLPGGRKNRNHEGKPIVLCPRCMKKEILVQREVEAMHIDFHVVQPMAKRIETLERRLRELGEQVP